MKTCAEFTSELASAAAGCGEMSSGASQHLKSCAACQTIFAELNGAAKLQHETASALPVPEENFDFAKWFSRQAEPGTFPPPRAFPRPRFRIPVIASAALASAALIAFIFLRLHHGAERSATLPPTSGALHPAEPHGKANLASTDQTLRGLRHDILGKPDGIESAFPRQFQAAVSNPVRLKDAYFQND
jgi:hypothetical protein